MPNLQGRRFNVPSPRDGLCSLPLNGGETGRIAPRPGVGVFNSLPLHGCGLRRG